MGRTKRLYVKKNKTEPTKTSRVQELLDQGMSAHAIARTVECDRKLVIRLKQASAAREKAIPLIAAILNRNETPDPYVIATEVGCAESIIKKMLDIPDLKTVAQEAHFQKLLWALAGYPKDLEKVYFDKAGIDAKISKLTARQMGTIIHALVLLRDAMAALDTPISRIFVWPILKKIRLRKFSFWI